MIPSIQRITENYIVALRVLSRRWYILLYHMNTLLLPLGEGVAEGGGMGERSEVIYCIERDMVIYYKIHNGHSCIV